MGEVYSESARGEMEAIEHLRWVMNQPPLIRDDYLAPPGQEYRFDED